MAFDVYQAVTDRILELLEQGTVPWKNPIRGAAGEWPKNLASGKPYRGVNIFLLAMTALAKGYDSPWWVTFRQAKERGGAVKKGEKSTMVVFYKPLEKEDERTGELKKIPLLRYYRVFNAAAQCDGLAVPEPAVPPPAANDFTPLDEAERIVRGYPNPPAVEHLGHAAYYRFRTDTVTLPPPERFDSREDFYATEYHELIHSTGIEKRLNRGIDTDPKPFGSPDYSKEELVAEMGAAFLCAVAGISPQTIDASASYIDGWRKKLKGDKRLVVQAAGQAQKATDHILGVSWDDDGNRVTAESPADPLPAQPATPPPPKTDGPQGLLFE